MDLANGKTKSTEEKEDISKLNGSDVIKNSSASTEDQTKGVIAIGIAKLHQAIRIIIQIVKTWAYYVKVICNIGQLTIEVLNLALEIAKLFLEAVKANTHIFVELFQQMVTIFSPNFIQQLPQQFAQSLQKIVEEFMVKLEAIIKSIAAILEKAANPFHLPVKPILKPPVFKEEKAEKDA